MENQKQFQKFGLTMRFFVWVIYCSLYHGTEYGIEYNSWLFIYRERKCLYISFKARILQTLFHRVFIYFYFWLTLMIYFYQILLCHDYLKICIYLFYYFLRQGVEHELCCMCESWRIHFWKSVLPFYMCFLEN